MSSGSNTQERWRVGREIGGKVYNPAIVYVEGSEEGVCQVVGVALHTTSDRLDEFSAKGLERARLIAAAPELLAVCKLLVEWDKRDGGIDVLEHAIAEIVIAAQDTISKVEGKGVGQ